MPNYEVDQGSDQIKALRKEIEDEREYYDNLMRAMHDEKAQFEEGLRERYMKAEQAYDDTLTELHKKELYNKAVVGDHVELKHVFELEERAS